MRNFNSILLNSFFNDRLIRINLVFCGAVNLLLWLFLAWQYTFFTDLIALHYNIYFGIDLLGQKVRIFEIPLAGLIFASVNFLIAGLVFTREKILSYFLVIFCSLLQLLLAMAALTIVIENL